MLLVKWLAVCVRRIPVAAALVAALTICSSTFAAHAQNKDLVRADEDVTTRAALVIGNTNYEYRPLKNPVNDARAIATALTKLGFKVTLKNDLNLVQMREATNAWADSLDSHTLALVYYSGHGVTSNGQNYFVPINNASITHKRDVPDLAYPFQRLLDATKEAGCPLRIFILDACRNDPLPKGLRGDDGQSGLAKISPPSGSFIAYAAGFGETASDNADEGNGLYTAALLKYINTPGLPIEQLFKRVRGAVLQASRNEQHPDESSQLVGEFCFAGSAANENGVAPLPKTASEVATDHVGRGDAFYSDEKYEFAAAEYTLAIASDPSNTEALSNRGGAFFELGQFEKSIADYNKAIPFKPDAASYINRGLAFFKLKQKEKAIADYTSAIRLEPNNTHAYLWRSSAHRSLALDYQELYLYDKAIAEYSLAIADEAHDGFPTNDLRHHLSYWFRGMAYEELNRYDKSVADYTEAIKLAPNDLVYYKFRGGAYINLKQYEKAIKDLTTSIKINGDNTTRRPADAYSLRADAYYSLKQYEKAVADYTKAVGFDPNDADTYESRANTYYDMKRYNEAITDFTKTIRLRPLSGSAYIGRGSVYYDLRQFSKALSDYRRSKQIDPKHLPDWLPQIIKELERKARGRAK